MTTFTETEIKEQPQAWAKTFDRFRSDGENIRATLEGFADKRLLFTGCGTSYYLALSAASAWTAIAGRAGRAVTVSCHLSSLSTLEFLAPIQIQLPTCSCIRAPSFPEPVSRRESSSPGPAKRRRRLGRPSSWEKKWGPRRSP